MDKTPFFRTFVRKNDPHIGVLVAFLGFYDKLCGKKQLDLKGLASQ